MNKCFECGSQRLRLNVPPDFEAFETCKDCGKVQEGINPETGKPWNTAGELDI